MGNDCITILHKAREGLLALPVQTVLHPTRRITKSRHQNSYQELQVNKDVFKFSFYPRTVKDWNNLPPSLTQISDPTLFKTAIQEHFKSQ